MTRVYVAGSSLEVDRCERIIAKLRAAGFSLTHDWCASVRVAQQQGRTDRDLSSEEANLHAAADMAAVQAADVFVLLVPSTPSRGCWVELGIALERSHAYGRPLVIASGDDVEASIFLALVEEVTTDEDLVSDLLAITSTEAA